jgi:hypothetical protein
MFKLLVPFTVSLSLFGLNAGSACASVNDLSTINELRAPTEKVPAHASVDSDLFEKQKAIIDWHIHNDNANSYLLQIKNIERYTTESMDPQDPYVYNSRLELGVMEGVPSVLELHKDKYLATLGGLFRLRELTGGAAHSRLDVMEAALIAAALLSPHPYLDSSKYPYDHNLSGSVSHVFLRLEEFGSHVKLQKQEVWDDEWPKDYYVEELYKKTLSNIHTTVPKFFIPLVLIGKDAVFSEKLFIYALSKGVVFMGLSIEGLSAHGGLFKWPIEAICHDQGHANTLLTSVVEAPRRCTSSKSIEYASRVLIESAGTLYSLIEDNHVFNSEEKLKAIRAAFYLFHESRIHYFIYGEDEIKGLKPIEKRKFLNALRDFLSSTLNDDLKRRRDKMDRLFASDFAKDILEVQDGNNRAAVELEIYGSNKNLDRTLHYDGTKVLELSTDLVNWFMDKVLKDERTNGFFGDATEKH